MHGLGQRHEPSRTQQWRTDVVAWSIEGGHTERLAGPRRACKKQAPEIRANPIDPEFMEVVRRRWRTGARRRPASPRINQTLIDYAPLSPPQPSASHPEPAQSRAPTASAPELDDSQARTLARPSANPLACPGDPALAQGERCVLRLTTDPGSLHHRLSFPPQRVLKDPACLSDRPTARWILLPAQPEALEGLRSWLAQLQERAAARRTLPLRSPCSTTPINRPAGRGGCATAHPSRWVIASAVTGSAKQGRCPPVTDRRIAAEKTLKTVSRSFVVDPHRGRVISSSHYCSHPASAPPTPVNPRSRMRVVQQVDGPGAGGRIPPSRLEGWLGKL